MSLADHTVLLIISGILGVGVFMFVAWLVSLKLKDASIVDRLWGLNFILLGVLYYCLTEPTYWRQWLTLGLICVWGGRLSLHIHLRNHGHPEDYRYQAMRQSRGESFWWFSLFFVFLLQGVLAFLISAPVLWIFAGESTQVVWLDWLGVSLWGIGFYFEVVGDRDLKRFRANPANKGKVLNHGLWALTRHPNYFGDALMWWGIFVLALPLSYGWLSCFGPLMMSFFLRYVSGVSLLEESLRKSKPGYEAYMTQTPAFVPNPVAILRLCFRVVRK